MWISELLSGSYTILKGSRLCSWRRQWHPTPVLLPGKSHGLRSLVSCRPWGREESDTTERLHFHALEKEMAAHSSVLAWRIPGTGEPGGPPSMGSHRVGHDWSDLAAAAAAAADFVLVYDRNSQLARIITNRGLAQLSCLKLCKTFVIISLFICKGYVDNWYRKAECVLYS